MVTRNSRALLPLVGLIALSGIGVAYQTANAQNPPSPPTSPTPQAGKGGKERHPEMRAALRALKRAEADLQKADKDFSGHREKALDLTQQAIKEVEAGIKSDKN